jgi:hypothetical protein
MTTRYGSAQSPQPYGRHTCKLGKRVHRSTEPTSQDDCPACEVDRREGWSQLLASFRTALRAAGDGTHRE